jgi:hypothetical protein
MTRRHRNVYRYEHNFFRGGAVPMEVRWDKERGRNTLALGDRQRSS